MSCEQVGRREASVDEIEFVSWMGSDELADISRNKINMGLLLRI